MMRRVLVRKHLRSGVPVRSHWSLRKVGDEYRVRSISGRELILGDRFIEDASPEAIREVLASVSPSDRETLGQTILARRVLGKKAPDLNRGGEIRLEHFRGEGHPQMGRTTSEQAQESLFDIGKGRKGKLSIEMPRETSKRRREMFAGKFAKDWLEK